MFAKWLQFVYKGTEFWNGCWLNVVLSWYHKKIINKLFDIRIIFCWRIVSSGYVPTFLSCINRFVTSLCMKLGTMAKHQFQEQHSAFVDHAFNNRFVYWPNKRLLCGHVVIILYIGVWIFDIINQFVHHNRNPPY